MPTRPASAQRRSRRRPAAPAGRWVARAHRCDSVSVVPGLGVAGIRPLMAMISPRPVTMRAAISAGVFISGPRSNPGLGRSETARRRPNQA